MSQYCTTCKTTRDEAGRCACNPTPEDKAVALAELVCAPPGLIASLRLGQAHVQWIVAMLAERDKQHTEELAQGSGVMPEPAGHTYHDDATGTEIGPPTGWYSIGQMSEAIAALQAQLKQAEIVCDSYAKENQRLADLSDEVREQTRREVLEEAAKLVDAVAIPAGNYGEFVNTILTGLSSGIRSLK